VIIDANGGEEPDIHLTSLEADTEFDRIHEYIRVTIEEVNDEAGEVAVDIRPGREVMPATAFAAGIRYGADHVYYLYLHSSEH